MSQPRYSNNAIVIVFDSSNACAAEAEFVPFGTREPGDAREG